MFLCISYIYIFKHSLQTLQEIFQKFGEISTIEYPINIKSQKYKGYAYIRYINEYSMNQCFNELNNTIFINTNSLIIIEKIIIHNYFSQDENL